MQASSQASLSLPRCATLFCNNQGLSNKLIKHKDTNREIRGLMLEYRLKIPVEFRYRKVVDELIREFDKKFPSKNNENC